MPFSKCVIEPIELFKSTNKPENVELQSENNQAAEKTTSTDTNNSYDLEGLSNLALANAIRQLSALGKHACRIFDELKAESVQLNDRMGRAQQRIENLKLKCQSLDYKTEQVSFFESQVKIPFKSLTQIDEQLFRSDNMPEALKILYERADASFLFPELLTTSNSTEETYESNVSN
jgi:hypothetical protein